MSKFELKWGILATGGIAESFARDLWPNPETRGVKDIEHKVVAAASSSSAKRAEDFLKEVRAPEGAKAYGSYKELVEDPNVDIIYVATPHSHHYQNARLCLEAGKNVLCEKAFTTNAAQLETLIKIAKEKNVFLMEAVSYDRVKKAIWLLTYPSRFGPATFLSQSTSATSLPPARSALSTAPPPTSACPWHQRILLPTLTAWSTLTSLAVLCWILEFTP
jgi:dihydrodiol dehydrogenase / D-xylose 1-dehydrogenase (NADP)